MNADNSLSVARQIGLALTLTAVFGMSWVTAYQGRTSIVEKAEPVQAARETPPLIEKTKVEDLAADKADRNS
jgi:hypothetical protein